MLPGHVVALRRLIAEHVFRRCFIAVTIFRRRSGRSRGWIACKVVFQVFFLLQVPDLDVNMKRYDHISASNKKTKHFQSSPAVLHQYLHKEPVHKISVLPA